MRLRILLPLCVLALGALPLAADEGAVPVQELSAFLEEADPTMRLMRGVDIVVRAGDDAAAFGARVEEAWAWDADVAKGRTVSWKEMTDDGVDHTIYAYAPPSYTTEKAWPLLVWMHGLVARDEDGGGEDGVERFAERAAAEGFLVLSPSTQRDAMWWTPRGVALLRAALAKMKRRYRVDADRVCAAGFSDGGSACFHLLSHDPDPYCCFLSFVGSPLSSRLMGGPTWASAVATRPIYVANGGQDRLFPAAQVRPFCDELEKLGCDLTFVAEPELGHDWALLEKRWDEALAFWKAHPRAPLPRRVVWTTSMPEEEGRRAWVEIVEIAKDAPEAKELPSPDLRRPRLGIRLTREFSGPGLMIEEVEEDTPAAAAGLVAGDVILKAGDIDFLTPEDLRALPPYLAALGDEDGTFLIRRGEEELEIRARPALLEKDRPPRAKELGYDLPAGRIEAEIGAGNVIEVQTRGVRRFRLHLSAKLVDLSKPLTVRVNGAEAPVFSGPAPTSAAYVLAQAVGRGPGAPLTHGVLELEVPAGK